MNPSASDPVGPTRYGIDDVFVAGIRDRVREFMQWVGGVHAGRVPDEQAHPERFDRFWGRMSDRMQAVKTAVDESFPFPGRPRNIQWILEAVMQLEAGLNQCHQLGDHCLRKSVWSQAVATCTPFPPGPSLGVWTWEGV